MGTVPIMTEECSIIPARMASMSPPVERSMTASAPASMATRSLSISSGRLAWSAEVPILALILVESPWPIALASKACNLFFGITTEPSATLQRISSGDTRSYFAAWTISGVVSPLLADSSCVMIICLLSKHKGRLPDGKRPLCGLCTRLISLRRHYPDQVGKGSPEIRYLSPRTPLTSKSS